MKAILLPSHSVACLGVVCVTFDTASSFSIFHLRAVIRHAVQLHRTNPMGVRLTLISFGVVQHLNLRVELPRPFQFAILLVHHNISRSRRVVLIQALNVQPNMVTWANLVHSLMVHLHCEHFPGERIRNLVRGQENTSSPGFTIVDHSIHTFRWWHVVHLIVQGLIDHHSVLQYNLCVLQVLGVQS